MNNFGDFLYFLRKEKGITQSELAQKLGVTNKAVSKWETGESMPETSLLLPIAKIFDISVDELLNGKKKENNNFSSDNNFNPDFIKQHLFTKGKNDNKNKTLLDVICGAICATIFLLGLLAYFIIGISYNLWHPYWLILPCSALFCGIVGITFDLFNKNKRLLKIERGENPITAAICGYIMLTCLICYLLLGAILNMWHPLWIIVICGIVLCGLISTFGEIYFHVNKKNKN